VVEKGAFTGEEGASNLESLGVPELRLFFPVALDWTHQVAPSLDQKSNFSGDAEVANADQRDLLQETVPGELKLVPLKGQEISHLDSLDLHYVADIQVVYPFVLVQIPQNALHVSGLS